jgi:hypothetical protein
MARFLQARFPGISHLFLLSLIEGGYRNHKEEEDVAVRPDNQAGQASGQKRHGPGPRPSG